MKSHLLNSVLSYLRGNFDKAEVEFNLHFTSKYGAAVLSTSPSAKIVFNPSDWDAWIHYQIKNKWSGEVSLAIIFRELWLELPDEAFPRRLARFHYMDYPGCMFLSEESAFELLRFEEVIQILEDACRAGQIIQIEHDQPFSLFCVIDAEFPETLDREQTSSYFADRILAAIARGTAQRPPDWAQRLVQDEPSFLAKLMLKELFLNGIDDETIGTYLFFFMQKFPDRAAIVMDCLRNHMDSIPSDDDLSDFIFLYTGGRVLTEDPRGWMLLFIQSVETGKVLMPLE
jgi:hypothetical protein